MKPKLNELKFEDFKYLVDNIIKLSKKDELEPFILTYRIEHFITGLNSIERFALNLLIMEYLETQTILEDDFKRFVLNCRNKGKDVEIDENGKTPPELFNFCEIKLLTIKHISDVSDNKKTLNRYEKQINDAWSLKQFIGLNLTKDYKEQGDFLINKYRSDLVSKEIFKKYCSKIEKIFGTIEPWEYIMNYCKSKRIKETFVEFLKTTYEILDCVELNPELEVSIEYIEKFKKIIEE